MSNLKVVLAVCSTAVALGSLYINGNGSTLSAVVGFWGVLLGHEIAKEKAE